MGILNHLFRSKLITVKTVAEGEADIVKSWYDYLATVPEKEKLIAEMSSAPVQKGKVLQRLEQLLKIELIDVGSDSKEEEKVLSDLKYLDHSERVKRIHQLDLCLRRAETKYEYVHQMLGHLFHVLRLEAHILKKIQKAKNPASFKRAVEELGDELKAEKLVIEKVGSLKTFHNMICELVNGLHVIAEMDDKEDALLEKMHKDMQGLFMGEVTEGVTVEWANRVFDSIEERVEDAVANNELDLHPDVILEWVNTSSFVDLSRETIEKMRNRKVSDQMLNVFVRCFREWYNRNVISSKLIEGFKKL